VHVTSFFHGFKKRFSLGNIPPEIIGTYPYLKMNGASLPNLIFFRNKKERSVEKP